jgi:pimeloyl-ACP methyl ester carboxylesterase
MTNQKVLQAVLFSWLCCYHFLVFGQEPLKVGEHFAAINGLQIQYYVSGKGPVCLFPSPGWGPSVNLYRKTMQPFEQFFTMVYFNTRLSGKSTGPEDSTKYTPQHFVDDIDGLRAYLKQSKIWLMGHSSGGYQILSYGIKHSDNLNGLIVLGASVCRDSLSGRTQMQQLNRRMENIKKTKGQDYFEKYYGKAERSLSGKDTTKYNAAERLAMFFPFYFHDEEKMKIFPQAEPDDNMSEKASRYTRFSSFGNEDLCSKVSKINIPTLVVGGDDDLSTDMVSQTEKLARSIPSSTILIIKNAGHFFWIEQPTQFFSASTKWLEQHNIKRNK